MVSSMSELQGKHLHDPCPLMEFRRTVFVPVPIIVGAGPSGLAVAACLKQHGLSSVVIERSKCIASLWQLKTYDRLRLHLPKEFCELPLMKFPEEYPAYPTKQQFIEYLEAYAARFDINPKFNETVLQAVFDDVLGMWRVTTSRKTCGDSEDEVTEYVSPWLIAATGENAEAALPEIEGLKDFTGDVRHTSLYRSGAEYEGKRVLVIGCGNSGMEVSLDLCNHGASPSIVVRDTVHVLPREMLGKSTFALSMWLLKWLPIQLVDHFLLALSRVILGDTSALGLHRPSMGPLQLKNVAGKTPVLDMGALEKIKSGEVKVVPGVKRIAGNVAEFANGEKESFDAIILATGYRSNVPRWLKEGDMFSEKNGFPRRPFPNGWKGNNGLYAAGFTKRGILGASMDATRVAEDIKQCWDYQTACLKKF